MSTWPSRLRASCAMRAHPRGVPTVSTRYSTGAATASERKSLSVLATAKTRPPRALKQAAVARPIPLPAPVTSAVRPSIRGSFRLPFTLSWIIMRTKIHNVLVLDLDAPGATRSPVNIEIADGLIARIDPSDRSPSPGSDTRREPGLAADRVIDGGGLLAIPGLVDAHLHSSGHFRRGLVANPPPGLFMLGERPPLEDAPCPPELYRAMVLAGAVEMLRSGITSVMDDPIYASRATAEAIDAVMGAYRDIGLRATVSIYQPNKTEYEWMPYLSQLLPPDLRRQMGEQSRPSTAQIMETYDAFFERWHGAEGGRLRCAASCSAPQRATDDYLIGLHNLAADKAAPLVMHVYESKVQRVAGQLRYGGSLVRHVRELGVLDERTAVVHAVWVDDQDI